MESLSRDLWSLRQRAQELSNKANWKEVSELCDIVDELIGNILDLANQIPGISL